MQFCWSLSREVVSPGPFSGLTEGGDSGDLEERVELRVRLGFWAQRTVLMEEGGVWEIGAWLLGDGVAWGKEWLGLLLAEEEVVWGSVVRSLRGVG